MRVILFPAQDTHSMSLRNFYPQRLVIFLRCLQNMPYLPSIPQAFKKAAVESRRGSGLRKVVFPVTLRGWNEDKQAFLGETVLAVRSCLNREYLRAPFWSLGVIGSCLLRCLSRGGRLENRSRHEGLLDWRGMPVPGGRTSGC